jgi:hypothetical protein
VWSSAKKNGTGRAFERVWTPANDGTCRLVETIVEKRTAVKEETTATTVGNNAVAVAPTTKEEIKDRLRQKYIAAQKMYYAPIHARFLGRMVETGVVIKLTIRNSAC